MRILVITLIAFLAACHSGTETQPSEQVNSPDGGETGTKRPNILILLADDMGYGDIGAFGSEIDTPNIDNLAAEGIYFTNFHVGAACSPTRTMLMTGVDNHLAGLGNMLEIQADNQFGKPGYEGHLNQKVVTVATLLRDAGYNTYMVGKWHLGHTEDTIPHSRGFDRSFALMESGADNWVEQPYAPFYDRVHYFENGSEVSLPTENYFSSDFYTNRIIENIKEGSESGKPFFAYVAYQAVHYPHQAPLEFIEKYNGVYDEGFEKLREARLTEQKALGIVTDDVQLDSQYTKTSYVPWQIPAWDALSDEEKKYNARRMQTYAGMLDNMDTNIGKILAYLEESGEADNTLILFLSDNGADPNLLPLSPDYREWYQANYEYVYMDDYQGDYKKMGQPGSFADFGPGWAAAANTPGSYYKTFSTEGGIRVPLIAKFPGHIKSGDSNRSFAYVKDIVPTLLEVAGIDNPGNSYRGKEIHAPDGHSMWPVFTGDAEAVHGPNDAIGYELAGSSAVFRGDYKLVQNLPPKGTGAWELYNTVKDPSEVNNLADSKPEIVAELLAAYKEYEAANNVVPVPDGYNPLEQAVKNSMRPDGGH